MADVTARVVKLHQDTYDRLVEAKHGDETFDQTIARLLDQHHLALIGRRDGPTPVSRRRRRRHPVAAQHTVPSL